MIITTDMIREDLQQLESARDLRIAEIKALDGAIEYAKKILERIASKELELGVKGDTEASA